MSFSAPKPRGPSQAELKARREEQRRLEEQEEQSKLEAERSRRKRISEQAALRRKSRGRQSLIATSELGTKSKLG